MHRSRTEGWNLLDHLGILGAGGTFLCSRTYTRHLRQAENSHVLNLSPPLNMDPKWFAPHVAYTIAKYGMNMCAMGMAEEFRDEGIAFNTLWPRTLLDTAAVRNLLGGEAAARQGRRPEIMADAAYLIFTRDSRECTGNFFIDDALLSEAGVTDFSVYRVDPECSETDVQQDLFL